jgi:hypothetical protein
MNPELEFFSSLLQDIMSRIMAEDPEQRPDASKWSGIINRDIEQNQTLISKTFIKLTTSWRGRSCQLLIDISTVRSDKELLGLLQSHVKSTHFITFLYYSGIFLHEIFNVSNHSTMQNEQNILELIEGQLQRYYESLIIQAFSDQ